MLAEEELEQSIMKEWNDDPLSNLVNTEDGDLVIALSSSSSYAKGKAKKCSPLEEIDFLSSEIGREKERVSVDEWGMDLVSYRTLEAAQLHKRMLERRVWAASHVAHVAHVAHGKEVDDVHDDIDDDIDGKPSSDVATSKIHPPLNEEARRHVEEWKKLEKSISPKTLSRKKQSGKDERLRKPQAPIFPVDHGEVKREDWISIQLQKDMDHERMMEDEETSLISRIADLTSQ
eukprot:TRINITY_DN3372_c0_g1_i2.p1 TRINITY_DN3372_c0_g1~~TRINITY_DN3372_c0_g1_i2.p1  ORF type:complete len:232 (-),score=84.59 TRINITY_DN3372_c0_g1_i2:74-769(-)